MCGVCIRVCKVHVYLMCVCYVWMCRCLYGVCVCVVCGMCVWCV